MTPPGDPTVLVADDHPALLVAVCGYLSENGFQIVGRVSDGRRAVALAETEQPDIALIDLRMPRLGGVELVRAIREIAPDTRIAVYTADADDETAQALLEEGANAVVLKDAPLADVVRALESVLAGRAYLDANVSRSSSTGTLTPREISVLELLAEGLTHEEIGQRLGIGAETVRTHLRKACDRLGATTRTQAVATALRLGLIA